MATLNYFKIRSRWALNGFSGRRDHSANFVFSSECSDHSLIDLICCVYLKYTKKSATRVQIEQRIQLHRHVEFTALNNSSWHTKLLRTLTFWFLFRPNRILTPTMEGKRHYKLFSATVVSNDAGRAAPWHFIMTSSRASDVDQNCAGTFA